MPLVPVDAIVLTATSGASIFMHMMLSTVKIFPEDLQIWLFPDPSAAETQPSVQWLLSFPFIVLVSCRVFADYYCLLCPLFALTLRPVMRMMIIAMSPSLSERRLISFFSTGVFAVFRYGFVCPDELIAPHYRRKLTFIIVNVSFGVVYSCSARRTVARGSWLVLKCHHEHYIYTSALSKRFVIRRLIDELWFRQRIQLTRVGSSFSRECLGHSVFLRLRMHRPLADACYWSFLIGPRFFASAFKSPSRLLRVAASAKGEVSSITSSLSCPSSFAAFARVYLSTTAELWNPSTSIVTKRNVDRPTRFGPNFFGLNIPMDLEPKSCHLSLA